MAQEPNAEERAVDAWMGAMGPDEGEQQQANPAQQEASSVEGADAPAEKPEQEDQPEQAEATQESEEAETETIEIDPDDPLFEQELEIDGKKQPQKLSLRELQQGYLRQQDYTRKTQDLARQREELPKLAVKQNQELSESYAKRLAELQGVVMQTVAAELNGVDLNKLATEDPFEYVRISNRARQVQELLQTVQKEQDDLAKKRQEEDQKLKAEEWSKSLEILNRDIPQFGPPVVERLLNAGKDWGFSRDEVAAWTDARVIKMLHALSDKKEVEAKKPQVQKKVAVVTKSVKPGKTATKNQQSEARAKLRKTGKLDDALSVFEQML